MLEMTGVFPRAVCPQFSVIRTPSGVLKLEDIVRIGDVLAAAVRVRRPQPVQPILAHANDGRGSLELEAARLARFCELLESFWIAND
jgi:hypothetical protein